MIKLTRDQTIAIAGLWILLAVCFVAPLLALKARADAADALADASGILQRLDHARQHHGHRNAHRPDMSAPAAAFLDAQTSGLASAQLEDYIAKVAAQQSASLISFGIEPDDRTSPVDAVRVQATLNIPYAKLQSFLYQIEAGTPYVFVESISLQSASEMQPVTYDTMMEVTLGLRALWRHDHV